MRKRTRTALQNVVVYASILGVLGWDLFFYALKVVREQKGDEAELRGQIKGLENDWKRKEQELQQADQLRADAYIKEIASRREELLGYGNFLPPDSQRPEVQKFILQTIEDLHIEIQRTEEVKLVPKTHYSTLDIALTLRGTYRDLKLLLARIHKSEQFIRVRKFDINSLDDEEHMQTVEVQFQTYFSAARR